jgi:hypothetical protein
MTNQFYHHASEIAARVLARRESRTGAEDAQMRRKNAVEQLPKSLSWYDGRIQSRAAASRNTLLEQQYALLNKQGCGKRVLLSFCAKPGDKPVEIDLARYMQLGLRRPTSNPRNLTGATNPIRLLGERFHNQPALSLFDAWLKWGRFPFLLTFQRIQNRLRINAEPERRDN